jgi:hypothetical protein
MVWVLNLIEHASKVALLILPILVSGLVGYFYGAAIAFRDQKLRAYEEILPIFIKVAFELSESDQPEFNKAVMKVWLFASKNVALKVDHALAVLIRPERGDAKEALQDVISEMRADIQLNRFQRIKPSQVSHFYRNRSHPGNAAIIVI